MRHSAGTWSGKTSEVPRLVENNRIARKPNVNGFENRFRKAT